MRGGKVDLGRGGVSGFAGEDLVRNGGQEGPEIVGLVGPVGAVDMARYADVVGGCAVSSIPRLSSSTPSSYGCAVRFRGSGGNSLRRQAPSNVNTLGHTVARILDHCFGELGGLCVRVMGGDLAHGCAHRLKSEVEGRLRRVLGLGLIHTLHLENLGHLVHALTRCAFARSSALAPALVLVGARVGALRRRVLTVSFVPAAVFCFTAPFNGELGSGVLEHVLDDDVGGLPSLGRWLERGSRARPDRRHVRVAPFGERGEAPGPFL